MKGRVVQEQSRLDVWSTVQLPRDNVRKPFS